jgi:four helix bundle protein
VKDRQGTVILEMAFMSIQSYRDLVVWQKAMDLTEQCYQATKMFPSEERFGLTDQIRRAAVSVAANIAEGQGRSHTKEFLNHLSMARGSLMELETLLQIGQRVGYLPVERLESLLTLSAEVSRMSTGLRQKLEARL